jgi:hypothetical protein
MPDYRQSLPRFSLKDLLVSTTLAAAGLAAITVVITSWPYVEWSDAGLFVSGSALIGAGVLRLANRQWTGALLGGLIGLIPVSVVVIHAFNILSRM